MAAEQRRVFVMAYFLRAGLCPKAPDGDMTSIIWAAAALGAILKLTNPRFLERVSVVPYLTLGWIGVIALRPLAGVLDSETLVLLGLGAGLYTLGTLFHLWHRLPYQNSLWHGLVMVAAGCHYAAILHGVVGTVS